MYVDIWTEHFAEYRDKHPTSLAYDDMPARQDMPVNPPDYNDDEFDPFGACDLDGNDLFNLETTTTTTNNNDGNEIKDDSIGCHDQKGLMQLGLHT